MAGKEISSSLDFELVVNYEVVYIDVNFDLRNLEVWKLTFKKPKDFSIKRKNLKCNKNWTLRCLSTSSISILVPIDHRIFIILIQLTTLN